MTTSPLHSKPCLVNLILITLIVSGICFQIPPRVVSSLSSKVLLTSSSTQQHKRYSALFMSIPNAFDTA